VIYLVDGSNVLGRAGANREAVDDKRALLRAAASFARAQNARLQLFFDGHRPDGFAAELGSVRALFSGHGTADDLIVAAAQSAKEPVSVVTSDRTLAARVAGRRVSIVPPSEFLRRMPDRDPEGGPAEDWERYFSDPKNREPF
jgi:predicted RNA-binding protein with PIN domain